jgi:hypothetical protein
MSAKCPCLPGRPHRSHDQSHVAGRIDDIVKTAGRNGAQCIAIRVGARTLMDIRRVKIFGQIEVPLDL